MASVDWVDDLKVAELKEELKKRGLAVTGKKTELTERLKEHVLANEATGDVAAEAAPETTNQPIEKPVVVPKEPTPPAPAAEQDNKETAADKQQLSLETSHRKREREAADTTQADKPQQQQHPEKINRNSVHQRLSTENTKDTPGNKTVAPAPAETSAPSAPKPTAPAANTEKEEKPTRALVIENFVRPFTEFQVRMLLSDNSNRRVLAMWMTAKKEKCFVIFGTKADAAAAKAAVTDLKWPDTSPKRLHPAYISLREAEKTIATGAGNPDFTVDRIAEDGLEEEPMEAEEEPAAAPAADTDMLNARKSREWNQQQQSAPQLGEGADLRAILSRRILNKADGDEEMKEQGGVSALDDLFRKTEAKPALYWLPLSDAQVEERKKMAALNRQNNQGRRMQGQQQQRQGGPPGGGQQQQQAPPQEQIVQLIVPPP